MTDQELIDLVQQKTPEELTLAELDALSQGLRTSAALRDALLDRLHLEQYLGEALGRIELSVDRIISRAEQTPRGTPLRWLLGWGVATILLLTTGTVAYYTWWLPRQRANLALNQLENGDAQPGEAVEGAIGNSAESIADANRSDAPENANNAKGAAVPNTEETPEAAPPDDGGPQPWRLLIEAEQFARGNVEVDLRDQGRGVGVLTPRRERKDLDAAPFVEYDVEVPAAGAYQIELRYASDGSTPVRMLINGRVVKEDAAAVETVSRRVKSQRWNVEGAFQFAAGKNVLRLEAAAKNIPRGRVIPFPALDQLALKSTVASADGRPLPHPWDDVVGAMGEPPPFAEVCFDDFTTVQSLRSGDLRRWLDQLPGQPLKIQENANSPPVFDGLARLLAPWREDLALRLALYDHHGFKLHFWNGQEGVTLWYYAYPPTWAAYRTTRKAGEPKPAALALAATDNQIYARAGAGAIELRHVAGQLVMTRGDLCLLSVPLEEAPREVYLEGRAMVRGLMLARSEGLPDEPPPRPTVLRADKPALLSWKTNLPAGAQLNPLEDGAIELVAGKTPSPGWAGIALQDTGLYEAIFEIENPQPGTGIYLGDAKGPQHQVNFFRDSRTSWTSYAFLAPGDNRTESNHDIAQHPVPYALPRQWLKLILGCGTLKCWTSADGQHWSRALTPVQNAMGLPPYTHVGLCCVKGDTPRSIRLRRVEIRELAGITAIVPDELQDKALALAGDRNMELGQWLATVLEGQPADIDPVAWRRACAVRTLLAGPTTRLGTGLMLSVLAETLADQQIATADRLRLLEELALIAPTWEGAPGQQVALQLARQYERLGQQLALEGETQPYSAVARSLLTTPIFTDAPLPVAPESLVRYELLELLERGQWEDAVELCDRLEYFNRSHHPERRFQTMRESLQAFVTWAGGTAQRRLPGRGGAVLRADWRHPLIESLSKEGYNILAEFNAALEGEQYKDACQIISGADPHGALGLLPDAKDSQLLMSLAGAVDLAMREHPPLKQAMNEHFGQRGRLRVRQALADADVVALEAAVMQFSGTEAAAEAYLWLGDRAFAGGDFARALGQYRAAQAGNLPPGVIEARLRLAGAMLGREIGEPVLEPVSLGELKLNADEFEKLVAEMLKQYGDAASLAAMESQTSEIPPPAQYEARRWAEISGDLGRDPQNIPHADLDWAGRQLAAVVAGDVLLMSNRFQLAAYELSSGNRKWSAELGAQHGSAHAWPLMAMQPVVTGEQVFVRRVTQKGPELACVDLQSGKVRWNRKPADHVASDPLVVQDQLFALTVGIAQEPLLQVSLATLDPTTGDVLAQRPLVQMRDVWARQVPCQAAAVDDKIVAAIGGGVLCCDLLGQVRWSRRQTWIPPAADLDRTEQHIAPPIIDEGRVYVAQPGVRVVQCLDLASGRLLWEQVLVDLRRVVAVADEKLLVETASGLRAFQAASGKPLWSHEIAGLMHAQLCGSPGGLLYSYRQRTGQEAYRPCLVWVDLLSGLETARAPLANLSDKAPYLGPLVSDGARTWAFHGRGRDPKREIYELVSSEAISPTPIAPPLVADWSAHLGPALNAASAAVLPGWTLLTCDIDRPTRLHAWGSEREVLATLATVKNPVRFVREIDFPAGSRPKLLLDVGQEGDGRWGLDVRVGGDSLLSQTIEAGQTTEGWKQVEVDLTRYAGSRHWLFVTQRDIGKKPAYAYWKRLEVALPPEGKHN